MTQPQQRQKSMKRCDGDGMVTVISRRWSNGISVLVCAPCCITKCRAFLNVRVNCYCRSDWWWWLLSADAIAHNVRCAIFLLISWSFIWVAIDTAQEIHIVTNCTQHCTSYICSSANVHFFERSSANVTHTHTQLTRSRTREPESNEKQWFLASTSSTVITIPHNHPFVEIDWPRIIFLCVSEEFCCCWIMIILPLTGWVSVCVVGVCWKMFPHSIHKHTKNTAHHMM